jgi:hypothetical protein
MISTCVIQNEACSCSVGRLIDTITCSKDSSENKSFPFQEIKSEFEKSKVEQLNLILQNKNFILIPARAFENISVNRVDFSSNSIMEIDKDAFKGSLCTNQLNMKNCKISERTIDLSFNLIEFVANDTFNGLSQLKSLKLGNNKIS